MHEKDDLVEARTVQSASNTSSNQPSANREHAAGNEEACQDQEFDIDPPKLQFRRTADMLDQQHLQRGMAALTTSPNISMGGTEPETSRQRGYSNKSEHDSNREMASTIGQNTTTTIPLRAARVHKPTRQSRQVPRNILSEYTSQLMYLEALNQKHLKDEKPSSDESR